METIILILTHLLVYITSIYFSRKFIIKLIIDEEEEEPSFMSFIACFIPILNSILMMLYLIQVITSEKLINSFFGIKK